MLIILQALEELDHAMLVDIFCAKQKKTQSLQKQGIVNLKSSHPSSRPGIGLDSWDSVLLLYSTDTFSITSTHDA